MAAIAMKELLEAGVHFGHQTKRWNPKMKEYIFGERNGIYILDLGKTVKLFNTAEEFITKLAAAGSTILFVGTKRQAQDVIAEEAAHEVMAGAGLRDEEDVFAAVLPATRRRLLWLGINLLTASIGGLVVPLVLLFSWLRLRSVRAGAAAAEPPGR